MSGWKKFKIKDVVYINPENYSTKDQWDYINYLETSNLTEGRIDSLQKIHVGIDKIPSRAKRKVKVDDVLISTVRPNQKHYGIIRNFVNNFVVSTGFAVLRANQDMLDPYYLYLLVTRDNVTEYLSNVAEDSTTAYPSITPNIIGELDIALPPLLEQKAIAEILRSLDDKIDLLHRNNQTLEAMAETIFRQWFIEEADKFDKCLFGDEFDIVMGQSPPGNTYNEVGDGIVFFQGRSDFGFRFPTERVYCTSPKRIAKRFDVLLSVRAPVGDINMAMEECCIGRGLAAIRHKKGYTSYAYYKVKSLQDEFDVFEREGTVFGAVSKNDLKSIKTTMPSEKLVRKFEDVVSPIDSQIYFNTLQIRTLQSLRNALLPKLITGEIRVPV